MQLVVLASDDQIGELLNNWIKNDVDLAMVKTVEDFAHHEKADAYIDLLFDGSSERVELLKELLPKPVIINSVVQTLEKINAPFTRINAWPGFLTRPVIEASTRNKKAASEQIERIFLKLGKKLQWLPDTPGFITARVIAMIINEAWFALAEDVSTPEQIDAAMKLGTNYPYGPFEWSGKIGTRNIFQLLNELAKADRRYEPAAGLQKQASG